MEPEKHNAAAKLPKTIMVYVGLDRLGDSLLKLPFVQALRTAYPQAHITWVAGKETSVYASVMAPAVEGLLDEVVEYAGIGKTLLDLFRRPLGGRRFDMIIDTQRVLWVSLSLKRVPHGVFISPAGDFRFSMRKPPKGHQRPKTMLGQMLVLLELATGHPVDPRESIDLKLDPALFDAAAELLVAGPTYVGIAPGSGGLPKCWPLDNFIQLAKLQAGRGRIPVFILGPKETDWLEGLAEAVPEAMFPLQREGVEAAHGFAPPFTIALTKLLAVTVSNDSGIGHMVAVGREPLISLFGPTSPEKFPPMTDKLTIVRAQDFGGEAMALIPVDVVAEAVEKVLSG